MIKAIRLTILISLIGLSTAGCGFGQTVAPTNTPAPTATLTQTPTPIPTSTPTPLPTEIMDREGVPMRLIPAGEFTMKFGLGQGLDRTDHKVYLDAFYIDKYEVTNARYTSCVSAGICEPPIKEDEGGTWFLSDHYGKPEYNDHPVMLVNWSMANAYCAWRGIQLPTEAQWEKAALGTDGRSLPWGEGLLDCDKANYNQWAVGFPGIPDDPVCGHGNTAIVGSYKSDVSPYGIFDMAGNVSEWVADWYDSTYYQNSPLENPPGPASGTYRVVRGGNWGDRSISFLTGMTPPERFGYTLGFRCASPISP